ncbi:GlsB/YeaQ/YmgE family stress response membrane protein [Sphingobium boeckii]
MLLPVSNLREAWGMDGVFWWIIIGLVAGSLGKLIMPGKDPGGCLITVLIGIAGALLAGYIGQIIGYYEPQERAGWIAATLGAVALLVIYRIILKVNGKG